MSIVSQQYNIGSDLEYHVCEVTAIRQNACIITCMQTGTTVLLDPGGDSANLLALIKQLRVRPTAIWLTHGHYDHIGAVAEINSKLAIPVIGPHQGDSELIRRLPEISAIFGMTGVASFTPDRWLQAGDQLTLGKLTAHILHCPGHSPGSVVYAFKQQRFAFVGDVLFSGSIGRTDLPGGDANKLIAAITNQLWPLGDFRFQPGHGPPSSFGRERNSNVFVSDKALQRANSVNKT